MSELETILNKTATKVFGTDKPDLFTITPEQFKSALTEVLKLVEVTDEEIEKEWEGRIPKAAVQWSRDLSKTKLEKLIG